MPNIMIHEQVAYNIAKHHKELNTKNFYLGALAPDAVNVNGFAPKEARWTSHLRDSNLKTWRQNIITYYYQEQNNYPSDFLTGYLIHILTDIIFDDYFYKEVTDKIKEAMKVEDPHPLLLDYMKIYAFKNKDSQFFREIKEKLKDPNYYSIRNISKDLLKEWTIKSLKIEKQTNNINPYITNELIENLSTQVLKEYNNIKRN